MTTPPDSLPLPFPELLDELPPRSLLTVAEVAHLLRLSRASVYRMIQSGALEALAWRPKGSEARPTYRIPRSAALKVLSQESP